MNQMYSSDIIHNKVMNEYLKKQEKYQSDLRAVNDEIYSYFPQIKEIDNKISLLALKHANRIITENITPEEAVKTVKTEKDALLAQRDKILSSCNRTFIYPKYDCPICNDTGSINGQRCGCYADLAKKIISEAEKYGIAKKDIIIDVLAMTISSDPEGAKTTLNALEMVRKECGVHTVLGVSNISFGLPNRSVINANFYTMAMQKGLSAGIINPLSEDMMKSYDSYCALMHYDEHCENYISKYVSL